jgi:hypothetical protein
MHYIKIITKSWKRIFFNPSPFAFFYATANFAFLLPRLLLLLHHIILILSLQFVPHSAGYDGVNITMNEQIHKEGYISVYKYVKKRFKYSVTNKTL